MISLVAAAAMVAGAAALGSGTAAADVDTRPIVDSAAYRHPYLEPNLNYNVGVPGVFTLRARVADAASFAWRTDDGQSGTVSADAGRDAIVTIAPRRAGRQFLTVHTVGRDGTEYAEYAYEFLVDDGPVVVRDPGGIVYLGATPTFHLTPRMPNVEEYLVWPYTGGGQRPEQTVTVPARADGTADVQWYMHDTSMIALLVQSRDVDGKLSEIRMAGASPDPAAPQLTRAGGEDVWTLATFTARTEMPGVVAYDVTFNDEPATKQSITPAADGSATFSVTPTRAGANWVYVTARNAKGLTTAKGQVVWHALDFPYISSTDFPLGVLGKYGRKAPGDFSFTARLPGTTAFEWGTGPEWATLPAGPDGKATLTWTPDRTGSHTMYVRSVTADGKRSSIAAANFAVAVVNAHVDSVSPTTVTTGEKRTLTIEGMFLHPRDVIEVTPSGRLPVPATIRSVDPAGSRTVVEVDFAAVPPGRASVTVKPYGGTLYAILNDAITVAPLPALELTKAPAISGSVKVGDTIQATAGTWSPAATSVTYRWNANGVAISGATGSSYKIPASLAGKRLSVTVTASRAGNTATSATSASTSAVAKGSAPKATKKPKITGTAKVGRTLQASPGTWSPTATSYRYEWRLNGKIIKGAAGRSLKLKASMRNKRITVTVIAKRTGHLDGRATSASVTVRR
ncbi:hypothetical protein AB0C02_02410 [Micromonospora sp. NPDC048999]|uniref:hypothetical protein n=1 Tax=Micromonospora sp. NPDC048999 TaxID=3155391 RepID=UPI003408086B